MVAAQACHYVADHCRAQVIVVEDDRQLEKILAVRDRLTHLITIVKWKGPVRSGVYVCVRVEE